MFMHTASEFQNAQEISRAVLGAGRVPREGLLAGSLVETPQGWCTADLLSPGDRVATFDGGLGVVTSVDTWSVRSNEAILVPGNALDNCSDLHLLPEQKVLLRSRVVEEVLDCAGVLIPAADLVGFKGIRRTPLQQGTRAVVLRFAQDEIVYVNTGVLLHCPAEGAFAQRRQVGESFFPMLSGARASAMLSLMSMDAISTECLAAAA